jgi:hypothetical protein
MCNNGVCGPPMCVADGGACNNFNQCCAKVCNMGICNGPCQPMGSSCMGNGQCCTHSCQGGFCGCRQDGANCTQPAQCCSKQCNNGFCGPPPVCATNGMPCNDCLAGKCCNQETNCFKSPACTQAIGCFLTCVQGMGGLPQCFFQCIAGNNQATQLLGCLGQNCGMGVCF